MPALTAPSAELVEAWTALADHFLDTETRHWIPHSAMRCIEAGLSVEEADVVWREDICPAVGMNALSVAGEWAMWDPQWLVARIEQIRASRVRRLISSVWAVPRVTIMDGVWQAVARSMRLLAQTSSREGQWRVARDLEFWARHYWDFVPKAVNEIESSEKYRLVAVYPEPFLSIVQPALVEGEAFAAQARTDAVLKAL